MPDVQKFFQGSIRLESLVGFLRFPDCVYSELLKRFGESAAEVLRENPFRLAEVDGVGWKKADRLSERLGFARDHDLRVEAGVIEALKESEYSAGHVCLPAFALEKSSGKILGSGVSRRQIFEGVARLRQDNKVVSHGDLTYRTWRYHEERTVADKIQELLGDHDLYCSPNFNGLAPDQVEAAQALGSGRLGVLTGPPGTGKTYLVRRLIESEPGKVGLAAPTGKAAKRLREMTGRPASTIHRLLGAIPGQHGFEFRFNAENPLDYKLLVIDEASMIDISLARHLLMAVDSGTRVIFVGDTDQLPPVGPGNFLRDLISSGVAPVACLTQIKRQNPGLIIRSCHAVRVGAQLPADVPAIADSELHRRLKSGPGNPDLWFVRARSESEIADATESVLHHLALHAGYHHLRDVQILSPYREKTALSCLAFNRHFQEKFTSVFADAKGKFRIGDKVIQTRNDYDLDIFNGDVGYVRGVNSRGEMEIELEADGSFRLIPTTANDLALAYCLTVHKYQGSENRVIILPIHSSTSGFFVQRNWIYTAISRARELCVIIGNPDCISQIVARNSGMKRWTGLSEMLKEVRDQ